MNAITTTEAAPSNAMTVDPAPAMSMMNFVAMALTNPDIDASKLEALLRMQREIVGDDARARFNQAMSAVQGEMPPVVRDAVNDQTRSKYARLETIDAVMRPIYARHGFSLSFNSEPVEGDRVRIACEVAHTAGHAKTYHLESALDTLGPKGTANKTALHGLGSAVSYLRRYLTCMIFHVVLANEDQDGNRERQTGELIGRPQVTELYALLAECSADPSAVQINERKFLDKMGLQDLRSIKDAFAVDFPRLKNALLTKRALVAKQTRTGVAA